MRNVLKVPCMCVSASVRFGQASVRFGCASFGGFWQTFILVFLTVKLTTTKQLSSID